MLAPYRGRVAPLLLKEVVPFEGVIFEAGVSLFDAAMSWYFSISLMQLFTLIWRY